MNDDAKVWIVVYSFYNSEDFDDNGVVVKVFDSEERAEAFLIRDYDEALNKLKGEENVYDVVSANNYGNNAEILVGESAGGDIYKWHKWRVQMKTIIAND